MTDCSPTLRASGHVDSHANNGAPPAVCVTGSVTHCLKADGFDASEDGTGRGQPITVAQHGHFGGFSRSPVADPLRGKGGDCGGGSEALVSTMAVRRLMPIECERLQGFPDGWTEWRSRRAGPGVERQADGPRYKQLGNSMAVPVIRWLGRRIEAARP